MESPDSRRLRASEGNEFPMLSKIRASWRLHIAVMSFFILLTGVLAIDLFAAWRTRSEMANLHRAASDAAKISRFVHELQKERGLSAAFVSAPDPAARRSVEEQRTLTDVHLTPARPALADFSDLAGLTLDPSSTDHIAQALAEVDGFDALRSRIDTLTISEDDAFKAYTLLIARLLDVTSDIAKTTSRSDVGALMSAYSLLLKAKESAAQERGTVAAALASGHFTEETDHQLIILAASEQTLFDAFKVSAPPSLIAAHQAAEKQPAWREAREMAERLHKSVAGAAAAVSGADWWRTTTARIGLMSAIEDSTSAQLLDMAAAIHDQATRSLLQSALLVVCCVTLGGMASGLSSLHPPSPAAERQQPEHPGAMERQHAMNGRAGPPLQGALANRMLGERASHIEQTIVECEATLSAFPETAPSEQWWRLQHRLGLSYLKRIRGDRAENIERAIVAFDAALVVAAPDSSPRLWAETTGQLALAYLQRIRGSRGNNIEQGVAHLKSIVASLSRDAYPEQWAEAQNALGVAYQNRMLGDRAENVERAIAALEAVFAVCTPESYPRLWCEAQNNLAAAYSNRIRGERSENLERAVLAYGAARSVRAHEGTAMWHTEREAVRR